MCPVTCLPIGFCFVDNFSVSQTSAFRIGHATLAYMFHRQKKEAERGGAVVKRFFFNC